MRLHHLLVALAVAAAAAPPTTLRVVGAMPNPASAFCASQPGGTPQILTGPDGGQAGFCAFGGAASTVDEWTLFRAASPGGTPPPAPGVAAVPPQAAVTAFFKAGTAAGGLGAAAADPCAAAGGAAATYKCAPPTCALGGPQLSVCTFPDGSSIASAALTAGPKGAPQLAKALGK